MNTLVLRKPRCLSIESRPEPQPFPGEVLLTVVACAICRTDAVMWWQGHRDLVFPRVLGHEICARRHGDPVGQYYAVWPGNACGTCSRCRSGNEHLCQSMRITGFHRDGGFGELLSASEKNLLPVPSALSPELAALAEPLGCAVHALGRSRVSAGERLLVYGAGTLGLFLASSASVRGAKVSIADPDPEKLIKSRDLQRCFNISPCFTSDGSLPQEADVVINATSSPDALADGLERLAPGGRYCLFSGLRGHDAYPAELINGIHYREAELIGSYGCTRHDMRQALLLLEQYASAFSFLIKQRIGLHDVERVLPSVLEGKGFKSVITSYS